LKKKSLYSLVEFSILLHILVRICLSVCLQRNLNCLTITKNKPGTSWKKQ